MATSRRDFPHQWLPEGLELKQWEQIEPWYTKLLGQAVGSASELEAWLTAAGELNSAVGEEGVKRYIAMTCQTDDSEREAAYLAFVREIEPKLKPIQNEIRGRYLDAPARDQLSKDRYAVFDRARQSPGTLSRGEYPPRDSARRARAAVPEADRRDDRDFPRRRAHPAPDGPFSRRDRSSRPKGSLGAFGIEAPARPRKARRPV